VHGRNEVDMSEDRYLREPEVQQLTGLSRTTRWRLERSDKFPKRRQLSDNAVGWRLSEISEWLSARPTRSEAA
jgi:prophage regulatory protein